MIVTSGIAAARHHREHAALHADDEQSPAAKKRNNDVKRALLSLYDASATEEAETRDYVVAFHACLPEEVQLSVRLFGTSSFTEDHTVTVGPTTNTEEEVIADPFGHFSTAVTVRGARHVGACVIAVGLTVDAPCRLFLRSVNVQAAEDCQSHSSSADIDQYDALEVSHERALQTPPISSLRSLDGATHSSSSHLLSTANLDYFRHCSFHSPVFRAVEPGVPFEGVFYAHPNSPDVAVVSQSIPVTARITKRKKSAQVYQIVASSGTYEWKLWISKDALADYDNILRRQPTKIKPKAFPPEIDFQHAQRGLEKLNSWLQDLLTVGSTKNSTLTYAMLNVPPRYMRVDVSEPTIEQTEEARACAVLFGDATVIPAPQVVAGLTRLFNPALSAKHLLPFLPPALLEEGAGSLSQGEVEAAIASTLEAWMGDISSESQGITKALLDEHQKRQDGWKQRVKHKFSKREFHKKFDTALRLFDEDGMGELTPPEVLRMLIHSVESKDKDKDKDKD